MANDFLHAHPALYERVFERSADDVCIDVFERHLGRMPGSILDFGCGTGRDLHNLARICPDCTGVDVVPSMIEFASESYPEVTFHEGDMRDLRLDRDFDVIMTLGSGINYMLTNGDLERALETFRLHSHPGTLLLIEPFNASSFIATADLPRNFSVAGEGVTARGTASYEWDATTQTLSRERVWRVSGETEEVVDSFNLRLLFSQELTYFLERNGFEVLEIFERQRSRLYVKSMYVVAARVDEG